MGHLLTVLQKNKIIAQDGFNRADNASILGNANTGQAWVILGTGVAGVIANQSYFSASPASDYTLAVVDVGKNRYSSEIKFTTLGLYMFLCFRVVDVNNFYMVRLGGGIHELFKRIAGSFTLLGSYTGGAVNDIVRVELNGTNSVIIYINGVQRISVSDSALASATKTGFGGFDSAATAGRYDEFKVVEI